VAFGYSQTTAARPMLRTVQQKGPLLESDP
jgi:hypothetical protein